MRFLPLLFFCTNLFAAPGIVQVTRAVQKSFNDPLPPKAFYVDVGRKHGVKTGEVLEVFRVTGVANGHQGGDWGLLEVPVGRVKVEVVGERISLARLHQTRDLSLMEYPVLMVGDRVRKRSGLPFR